MMELFHHGEVLPEGLTNEKEVRLIALDHACRCRSDKSNN
jgi:hypothetical protein